jgi:hypothetical protein
MPMLLAIAVQPKEHGDFASYLLLLLLAVACNYYLLLLNTQILQVILLFLGGIAVAVTILWSLLPRRDKFDPPGPLLDRSTQPKLFREIDEIAAALCGGAIHFVRSFAQRHSAQRLASKYYRGLPPNSLSTHSSKLPMGGPSGGTASGVRSTLYGSFWNRSI